MKGWLGASTLLPGPSALRDVAVAGKLRTVTPAVRFRDAKIQASMWRWPFYMAGLVRKWVS